MDLIPNRKLPINCDLGEGIANDAALMPFIDSCSIACGGHFGDEDSIRATIRLAKLNKVKIGAHPSYPDRSNFGRMTIKISPNDLRSSLKNQIDLFAKIAREEDVKMNHIKLHGALYNDAAKSDELAQIVADLLTKHWPETPLYVPPKSAFNRIKSNLKTIPEAFIDRTYQADLSLRPRHFSDALIIDPQQAFDQFFTLLKINQIQTVDHSIQELKADTFCIHGDQPKALEILAFIHQKITVNES